ncbi:WD repeat-containing protein 89 [Eurosta solidaginis]|uniref:WD repeat-containing protein 89 n=1 Tax=Eurosta solidaginis TaxID=178769 RepID=UPI00353131E7
MPSPNSSESVDDIPVFVDGDTCSAHELDTVFKIKWSICNESAVSLKNDYVLDLAADSGFTRVAAGLSSDTVHIFDINAGSTLSTFSDIPAIQESNTLGSVCGVRFLDETPNCLLIGSSQGIVRLFDLRMQEELARFQESIELSQGLSNVGRAKEMNARKAINCFASNSNGRIICTGTEVSYGNAYILFYDVRKRAQVGGYLECHESDITALQFHALNPDLLCSGSTDGLINIYDIKETTEEDALLTTINTESTVQKLKWHKNVYEQDIISCITDTNDFYVYFAEEGDVVAKFYRSQITAAMKRINEANCNVIDAHSLENGDIFLLSGTNDNKGEVMRALRFNNNLLPMYDFNGNKQIVRSSIFDKKNDILVTGGENGIVTLWTKSNHVHKSPALAYSSSELKQKRKKSDKKTPY